METGVRHIVNNCIISVNIDVNGRKHGPHALRSSLASSLVSGGVPYDTVRKILGHSDPDAIKHYVKTDIERLRRCAIDPPEPAGIFFELLDGRRQV
ncbi:MAG: tyrosine-type recombinase/integrase [Clostridia bacterium]|nr:tyrosine-type recombinase/integrase [Clostridia bacterium]